MLTISILVSMLTYMILKLSLDYLIGKEPPKNHLKTYLSFIRGDKTTERSPFFSLLYGGSKEKDSKRKFILVALVATVIFFVFVFILKNLLVPAIISTVIILYPQSMTRIRAKKRKETLNLQLKEAMQSISNSLKAGSSLQTAVERCLDDLKRIYKTQIDPPIVAEFETIVYEIQMGKSLDEALVSFRTRAQLEDVESFVNAALITKEKGGNLTEVMANVAEVIGDKLKIKREIMILTAGKRAEAKLLSIMPVFLVLVLTLLSPSYMRPMYVTPLGRSMMTIGVLLVGANYLIGKRIININI